LDGLWERGSIKSKIAITSELAAKESALTSNPFGRFILRKAALHVFKRSRDQVAI
jgi:hypothetical protein